MHTSVSSTFGRAARLVAALAVLAPAGAAQTLAGLYSFTGSSGANPTAGVVFGGNGSLFGTTPYGGSGTACLGPLSTGPHLNGCGTVFEVTPGTPWTETVLYSFQGGVDGANPGAALIAGTGGVFYGTTVAGGSTGNGTVFQIAAPKKAGGAWTETLLYSFQTIAAGSVDVSGTTVTLVSGNSFVTGTPWAGASIYINGNATPLTVASVQSSSELTLTAAPTQAQCPSPCTGVGYWENSAAVGPWLGWPDGSGPEGGVILVGGKLYGTTSNGGTGGAGTVFQLTPPAGGTGPWTEEVVYNFQGGKDGSGPQSGLLVTAGSLYGTTCCGTVGGTVFKLTPGTPWVKTPVYSFSSYATGAGPFGGLAMNATSGVLYGTTTTGGAGNAGIIFSLTPTTAGKPYALTTIHPFTGGSDGGAPYGGLLLGTNGQLYATVTSGCTYGVGGVLEFTPPTVKGAGWKETVLYSFTGAADGSQPFGGVILKNNSLYGTTNLDGASGYGTVFELTP